MSRPCSVNGCEKLIMARGLCVTHYFRLRRHGSVELPQPIPLEDRFWARVKKTGPDECWEWLGSQHKPRWGSPYGRFTIKHGVRAIAHRIAYELALGPIPEGLTIDHLCRNTLCMNPQHLEPVTASENSRRANSLRIRTHCARGGHELPPIGAKSRGCSVCRRELQRTRQARQRSRKPSSGEGTSLVDKHI